MVYGYGRVSSKGQGLYGTSLDNQRDELLKEGASEIYLETYTGKTVDRPELNKLMDRLQPGDVVIVTKIDRLARNTVEGLTIIDEIVKEKQARITILNLGTFDSTPAGQLVRTIFFAFAEYERNMIISRTEEGKKYARATRPDYKEGRPKKEVPDFEKYYAETKSGKKTVTECCEILGISRSLWYKYAAKI